MTAAKAEGARVAIAHAPAELDEGLGAKGRIGLIALSSDQVIEQDWRRLLPDDDLALYVSRITNADTVTIESLSAMEAGLEGAARLILPEGRIDVFAYGCTSGSVLIGEERVFDSLRKARPGIPCTTPITGALAAFERLAVSRIAVLTPYIEDVNRPIAAYLEARGCEVSAFGSFELARDGEIARVTPRSILEAARALDSPGTQAIFISCTALRALDAIAPLEAETGKPVITSNQAMAWHALRLLGYGRPIEGFGRLLAM